VRLLARAAAGQSPATGYTAARAAFFGDRTMTNYETNEPYRLLCDARELLGKAHDKIATATMNFGGPQNPRLIGISPTINDLIQQLHDACGACEPVEAR
jgi:hypothetical protein